MLQTKDLLYLVISFCIVWITVFLCWTFYYVMRLLRNANQIVEEFRSRLQVLMETINYIRGKVEHISGLMTLASGGVSEFVKKAAIKKAKQWIDDGEEKFDDVAKDAVEKAVEATAAKMKKAAHKLKK
ncbi:MAG: hypothetical protein AAB467_00960 [Patescibacteria group bacterium]